MPEVVAHGFPGLPGVRSFTTLRAAHGPCGRPCGFDLAHPDAGGSAADDAARRRLRRMLPSRPLWLDQVHGSDVLAAPPAPGVLPRADGMATRRRNVVCAVLTADCLPVVFASPMCVAAVHAGWRGLAEGVLENALAAMESDPSRVRAQIGPHIRQTNYQVGGEVRERLVCCADDESAFRPAPGRGKFLCNLARLAVLRLARAGLPPENVRTCALDTHSHGRLLYSARRDGPATGRMATVVWRA